MNDPRNPPRWDIFCRVVDNFGDIGVCWRLACQLAARGLVVRLWIDDARALAWMAPDGCSGVEILAGQWPDAAYRAADVVVDAFGAGLTPVVIDAMARTNLAAEAGPDQQRSAWINLEYLSAEAFVAASHGLPSPVQGGAPAGVRKWFFFPGFTPETGGLLRESDLFERQRRFDRAQWRQRWGIAPADELVLSLFCYEPEVLAPWLMDLAARDTGRPVRVLVTDGRAGAAVRRIAAALPAGWNRHGRLRLQFLPALPQPEFDHLLWAADLNFVRGEDSLVRAIWAPAPFVWQAYPQADEAHQAKLEAVLEALSAPASLRRYHRWWNGPADALAPPVEPAPWGAALEAARQGLSTQPDLVTRLLRFVAENR